jgi:hypothetical protein
MRNTPTVLQMFEDLADLGAGAVTVFLPLFVLAVPCAVLVVVPVLAAGAVLAVAGALLALPLVPAWLLVRGLRRRQAGSPLAPARGAS